MNFPFFINSIRDLLRVHRLLNYDVDKWAHLNCSLWSDGVYETVNGALVNVDTALQTGMNVVCAYCNKNGATLKCFKLRCSSVYHLSCAIKDECVFYKNKVVVRWYSPIHRMRTYFTHILVSCCFRLYSVASTYQKRKKITNLPRWRYIDAFTSIETRIGK